MDYASLQGLQLVWFLSGAFCLLGIFGGMACIFCYIVGGEASAPKFKMALPLGIILLVICIPLLLYSCYSCQVCAFHLTKYYQEQYLERTK